VETSLRCAIVTDYDREQVGIRHFAHVVPQICVNDLSGPSEAAVQQRVRSGCRFVWLTLAHDPHQRFNRFGRVRAGQLDHLTLDFRSPARIARLARREPFAMSISIERAAARYG
jgi:hypothetical protein